MARLKLLLIIPCLAFSFARRAVPRLTRRRDIKLNGRVSLRRGYLSFYQQENERRWREQARAAAIAADLEELGKLRHYLIFNAKAKIPTRDLIDAIDDHAERLTGDRRALHAPNHSIA